MTVVLSTTSIFGYLGDIVVRSWTSELEVAGSSPARAAIE